MKTRFIAYDRLGNKRGSLPNILEAILTPPVNELPTLTLHFPVDKVTSPKLKNDPEVAFEFFDDQLDKWVEPYNCRFRFISDDFDYLEEVKTKKYTFIGIGEVLRGQSVYGSYGRPVSDEGKVQFKKTNAGAILKTLWDQAVSRGWKGFTYDFNSVTDSAGQPWNHEFNISYSPENNMQAILDALQRQGNLDYAWEGRTLHAYKAHGFLARERSTGTEPVLFNFSGGPAGVDGAPESTDREELATHVIVLGEESLRWEFPTGAILPEGRREVYLTYSGVDDIGTARLLAEPTILKSVKTLINTTRQFHLRDDTKFLPFRDYRPGDWALAERTNGRERMRIFSMTIWVNRNGVHGYVSLGDRTDDLLEKMYQRIQGLQGGAANELPAKPPVPKNRIPQAPEGLMATSAAYVDSTLGITRGIIAANWVHGGNDTRNDPINLSSYVAEYAESTPELYVGWQPLFTVDHPEMSGTASPIVVYNKLGLPKSYQVRVKAVSRQGISSLWSNMAQVTMAEDTTPPPVPAVPNVEVSGKLFIVSTNYLGSDGERMPPDTSYFDVMMSSSEEGVYESVAKLSSVTLSTPVYVEEYGTRWFRLRAVDITGNQSNMSTPPVSAKTTPLVVDDIFNEQFQQINSDIEDARSTMDKKITISNLAPTETDLAGKPANALWYRVVGGQQVGVWRKAGLNSTSWTPMPLGTVMIPDLDAGKITTGEFEAIRIKAGSIGVKQLAVMDPENYATGGNFDSQDELDTHWISNAPELSPVHSIVDPATTAPLSGGACLRVANATQLRTLALGRKVPVKEGDKLRIEIALKASTDVGTNYTVNTKIRIADQSGTVRFNEYLTNIQTIWETRSWIFTVPAGMTHMDIRLWTDHTTGNIYFDNFRIRMMNAGELFIDGTVKANHIDTNSLTADTGFIAYLESRLIKSDVFVGKDFIGGSFTGSLIRSSPETGKGFKLTSTYMRVYNSVGLPTIDMNFSNGAVKVVGTVVTEQGDNQSILAANVFRGRPGLRMDTGRSAAVMPTIQSMGVGSGSGYPAGALIVNGEEGTTNSSGRADLALYSGGNFDLKQNWGTNNNIGISKIERQLRLMGHITDNSGVTTAMMFMLGTNVWPSLAPNTAVSYSMTCPPTPSGRRRWFVSGHTNTEGSGGLLATVTDESVSTFKIQLFNAGTVTVTNVSGRAMGWWIP